VFSHFDAALAGGVQLGELLDQLIHYLRDLMVLGSGAAAIELLAVAPDNRDRLAQQAEQWGLHTIVAALQILAETKTRMFRVPFARALAELGLLRIALLEDLRGIGELIRELKTGEPAGQPTTSAPRATTSAAAPVIASRPSAPATISPGAPVTPVKKNAPEPLSEQPTAAESTPSGIVQVPFDAAHEAEFWSQVLANFDDKLKVYLHGITRVAISGPNDLELTYPRSYNHSRSYWEGRPESLRRLEVLCSQVADRPVRIVFRVVDSPAEPQVHEHKPSNGNGLRREVETDDVFVQHAKTIFDATIMKVEPIASAPTDNE
jgi:DNA polymerase-3 subunit gamma/tau